MPQETKVAESSRALLDEAREQARSASLARDAALTTISQLEGGLLSVKEETASLTLRLRTAEESAAVATEQLATSEARLQESTAALTRTNEELH